MELGLHVWVLIGCAVNLPLHLELEVTLFIHITRSKGVPGGAGGGRPPKSGGGQKYIRGGDPCDLGSEGKNRGSAPSKWVPPRNGCPPVTKSWLRS